MRLIAKVASPLSLTLAVLLAGCAGAPEEAGPGPAGPSESAARDGAATAPERSAGGLGLSQERLIELLSEQDLSAAAFETTTFEDGREVMTASFPANSGRQVLWVAMFGSESAPHTVRLDFYPGNVRAGEPEAVQQALDRLLVALFPDWPEVVGWPEFAGARAWEEAAKLEGETAGGRVPVLETERDGVWLAALGRPPDVVNYVITTEAACRPSQTSGFYQGYADCR